MNCLNCGGEMQEGTKFCTKCGAVASDNSASAQPAPQPAPEGYSAPQYAQSAAQPGYAQTGYAQPGYAPAPGYAQGYAQGYAPPAGEASPPVSIMGYIGLMVLGGLPVIGLIVFIVLAVSSKNKNIRNFSLAWIILSVVGFILAMALAATFSGLLYGLLSELGGYYY